MKRIFFITFCLVFFNFAYCQDTIIVSAQKKDWRAEQMAKKELDREAFVAKYVDSLNTYKNSGSCELPYFFTSQEFDQKHGSKFWLGMHASISVRKLIIDRIDNYELLWCVEKSKDPRVHAKNTSEARCLYCKIPFDQFSTHELVLLRLDELMNINHLQKN